MAVWEAIPEIQSFILTYKPIQAWNRRWNARDEDEDPDGAED